MKHGPRLEAGGRRSGLLVILCAVVLTLTGCGLQIPSDPRGTLDAVTDGVLRAGASVSGDLVREEAGTLSGSEVTLIEGFAAEHSATIEWTVGSEETLVGMLEDGSLDVVIGGMTQDTPWVDKAGVTRGYAGIPGSDGRALVMLVPLGENRMLSALETYLDEEVGG